MSLKTYEPHKSSIGGMDANVMALLTYIIAIILNFISGAQWFAWIVPLIILIMEKNSMLVKFHAAQAFVLGVIGAIIYIILTIITWSVFASAGLWAFGLGGGYLAVVAISVVISILIAIFEILAMINAYKYKEYSIPFIGGLAEKFSAKMNKAS